MALRDGYSNFKFYQALPPDDYFSTGETSGPDVNTQGYETVTFLLNAGQVSVSTGSYWVIRMQHASASISVGAGTYSDVSEQHVIGSGISLYTTITSGKVFSICISAGSVALWESQTFAVGYRGKRQYVRLVIESQQPAGSTCFGAIAVLGLPANWAVNASG